MSLLSSLLLLIAIGVVFFLLGRMSTRPDSQDESDEESGWLTDRDAEKITVRSADNVRLLSEDQLKALEDSDEDSS